MPNQPVKTPAAKTFLKGFTGASDDPAVETQLEALLQHLYGFYHTEIDLSLNRSYRFLSKLGNPHLHLPRVVHIAGTNGKGSTTAMLRGLLEASGQSVHVYTSPHLVHPTERIRLAGTPITSEALIAVLNECIEINNGEPITFFEMFTCAAFLAFSRVSADWLLLETGMGGRLDTTNVISDPMATIITTISFDHQSFLGDTIKKIAAEKGGIMKKGVPCIVGYQLPDFAADIEDVLHISSQNLSPAAPLVREGAEWSSAPLGDQLLFRYGDDSILTRSPALSGNHQYWNTGAALAAFRVIAPAHFAPEILSTGLARTEWPGRLQTLENHMYQQLVPQDWELIVDGGHNDSAGRVLAEAALGWSKNDSRPLHLIVAMVNRKDAVSFLKPLLPYAASITLTEIEGEATTYTKEALANIAATVGFKNIATAKNAEEALMQLSQNEHGPARVLMTGSLFFMGNILAKLM